MLASIQTNGGYYLGYQNIGRANFGSNPKLPVMYLADILISNMDKKKSVAWRRTASNYTMTTH